MVLSLKEATDSGSSLNDQEFRETLGGGGSLTPIMTQKGLLVFRSGRNIIGVNTNRQLSPTAAWPK